MMFSLLYCYVMCFIHDMGHYFCLITSSSTRPSRIMTKEQKPSASSPISGSQDNFDAVDMDVCGSHSDSGAQSPSEHTSPKTSTLESCSTVNTTELELTKDGLAIDTPSELRPLDSKVSPSETVSVSETSAPIPTGTVQEESDGMVLTVTTETNQKHSPTGDNTTAGTDQEDSLEVRPARITETDQDGSSSSGVVGPTASREQSPSFSVKVSSVIRLFANMYIIYSTSFFAFVVVYLRDFYCLLTLMLLVFEYLLRRFMVYQ